MPGSSKILTNRGSWTLSCCCPLPARSAAQAVAEFISPLQRALECVTDAVLVVQKGGYHPVGQPHGAALHGGLPAAIGRGKTLHLLVYLQYHISDDRETVPGWLVRPLGYVFALSDYAKRALLAYHWHPGGGSRVTWPHLHVYDALLSPSSLLSKAHLPTGRVALEDVLRLAIAEFGVEPRRRHQGDWDEVLDATQAILGQRWSS